MDSGTHADGLVAVQREPAGRARGAHAVRRAQCAAAARDAQSAGAARDVTARTFADATSALSGVADHRRVESHRGRVARNRGHDEFAPRAAANGDGCEEDARCEPAGSERVDSLHGDRSRSVRMRVGDASVVGGGSGNFASSSDFDSLLSNLPGSPTGFRERNIVRHFSVCRRAGREDGLERRPTMLRVSSGRGARD